MGEPVGVGLATALEALRDDLESAWIASEGRRIRFRTTGLTVTLETVARQDIGGSGKVRWWIVEAGGSASSGSEQTQTLTLTLTPMLEDEAGKLTPLDINGTQLMPGR